MESTLEPLPVNVRIKISTLWASMLFVFAYVDLFSLYRRDVRSDLEAREISGFTIDRSWWSYYVLGSAVEVGLLAANVYYAWSWPKARRNTSMG